jgi:hypothetical protein
MAHKRVAVVLADIDVFASSWNGSANEYFNFSNRTNAPVRVYQEGNNTFPFVVPPGGNSISVQPGKHEYQLIGTPSTTPYKYSTDPALQAGNPKNVIIT